MLSDLPGTKLDLVRANEARSQTGLLGGIVKPITVCAAASTDWDLRGQEFSLKECLAWPRQLCKRNALHPTRKHSARPTQPSTVDAAALSMLTRSFDGNRFPRFCCGGVESPSASGSSSISVSAVLLKQLLASSAH